MAGKDLLGTGSTLVERFQNDLSLAYRDSPFRMVYTGTGSGAGKKAISTNTVDFAWSEAALTDAEQAAAPDVIQLPLFISGVAVLYNFPGLSLDLPPLNVSLKLMVDIYSENVKNWRDPSILALNPKLTNILPNMNITRYVRQDSSGSSQLFTDALKVAFQLFVVL